MTRIFRLLSAAFLIAFAAAPAAAQSRADSAVPQIRGFYDVLLDTMKHGPALGTRGRFEKLKPAVETAYDLPGMTALAVGPSWSSVSADDQKTLIAAFTRLTVASYAQSFNSYNGEKFVVDPTVITRGAECLVKSQLVPAHGDAVAFNYRMHEVDGTWKVIDVYLAGNISQLAQKRSDFSATFASGGPEALTENMDAASDRLLGP